MIHHTAQHPAQRLTLTATTKVVGVAQINTMMLDHILILHR